MAIFSVITIFLLTAAISFGGSLQVGPVNYFVVETCLKADKRSAAMVGLGGSIPELLYSSLAILFGSYLVIHETVFTGFRWIAIALLTALCIYYWKKRVSDFHRPSSVTAAVPFFKGLILGIFNPQLLPFWLVVYTSLFAPQMPSLVGQFAFIAGTGTGAFLLHLLLIRIADSKREKLVRLLSHPHYNKYLSVLFFILALVQLTSL